MYGSCTDIKNWILWDLRCQLFFVSLLKHSVKMGQRLFSNSIGKLYVLFLTSHCNFYRIAERSNIPLACTGGAENYTWWRRRLPLLDIFFSIKNYVETNKGSNLDLTWTNGFFFPWSNEDFLKRILLGITWFYFWIATLTVDYHVPLLYDASVNIQRCKRPCFLSVFMDPKLCFVV